MKRQSKLTEKMEEKSESAITAQQAEQAAIFADAEQLMRHDAAGVEVPPVIEQRLRESIAREPNASGPWWKRLFGKPSQ